MASIEKYQTKGGTRYRVRYRTPDGRSTDKGGFSTKREAEAWKAENLLARRSGTFVSETERRTRVGVLIDRYLAHETSVAETTVSNRTSIVNTWIRPDWESWPVGKVEHKHVQEWVDRIYFAPRAITRGAGQEHGTAGAATVQKAHAMLHSIFELGVRDRLLPNNPATGTNLPKLPLRPHPYLTRAELDELASAI